MAEKKPGKPDNPLYGKLDQSNKSLGHSQASEGYSASCGIPIQKFQE